MERPTAAASPTSSNPRFDEAWHDDRRYVLGLATRMLGDAAGAEDVVQEAFSRLARVPLDEIVDTRGWLAVVVRRLCLNRLRSAYVRREAIGGIAALAGERLAATDATDDPADRVTLDDQVQLALAVVLDRLSPAERTAFVLHDVFGFPFDAVGSIVGRTPAACRQLASRARRSMRADASTTEAEIVAPTEHHIVVERFIAACAGGDITELMAVLDPDVDGHAELFGFGPIADVEGRPAVAQRLIGMFGPGTDTMLVPVAVELEAAVIAFAHGRVAAVVQFEQAGGRILHMRSLVLPPTR
ncbi:MAG: polymerase sigma-70 factor, subfamily [Acidimicrobiaceae bacterium]|jgi:RNA polymerase sigma-70 factor (ECF subfamily)